MGFEANAAQSSGEYPGSRTTLLLAFLRVTGVGARVLLAWRVPDIGGPRWEAAADGGGRREDPPRRGGCSLGSRFGCGVGRGIEGGGIRLEELVVAGRGGTDCFGGGGAMEDGACDEGLGTPLLLSFSIDWAFVSIVGCGMEGIVAGCDVPLSSSRLNSGTARTGRGALEADALGVLWLSSSEVTGGLGAL